MTPSSRTLKLLKNEGKIAESVERWNAFTKQRKDLFSFIDIVALDVVNKITWGIQCTSTTNINARINKICNECKERAIAWLKVGNKIEVIGWSKKGKAGKRKTWQAKRKIITISDFT